MKKILTMALISILTLAGCGLFDGGEDVAEPTVSGIDAEVNADSVLDDQLYRSATASNNLEKCEKIIGERQKEECGNVVNANLLTIKAIGEMDSSVCDDINLERYKENCVEKAEEMKETQNLDENKITMTEKAIEEQDVSYCDEISDTNYKSECLYNFYMSEEYVKTDSSVCESIENNTIKELCIQDSKWY
jgi:hypothetical protein